MLPKKHGRGG
jgi:peptide chain release factor subunit 1